MSLDIDLSTDLQSTHLPAVTPAPPNADDEDELDVDLSAPQHLLPQYFAPPQSTQDVLTPADFARVPFSGLPFYIPGMTSGVQGFDGGINKAALEVHREKGLLCILLPYLDMAEGDFIELFCVDTLVPAAIYNVTSDDVAKSRAIPLYIRLSRLIDGTVTPVFMRAKFIGGGSEETTRLRLKVDTVSPAGRNPIASTLQNENLPMPIFPQAIVDFGVTDTDAQHGVPVTFRFYPVDDGQPANTYRAARDRIRLSIGGAFAPIPPLSDAQAAGRGDITVTLYYGFWQQVGSGSHVCEYEVIDEVGNASQGWSPPQLLNVRLNDGAEPLLPAAFVLEAPTGTLNHDGLNGANASIFVSTPPPNFMAGDIVRATVVGRTVSGNLITTTYDSPPLPAPSFVIIPCPNEDLRKLIGGRFQLSYERVRNGVPNRPSESSIVQVIGTPIETGLRAPIVIEANGEVIDPQLLAVNVEVLAYDGRDPFDLVTLILDGTYANGSRYYREIDKPAGTGAILFRLNNGPNGDIAKLEGGTLRVLYKVTNAQGSRTSLDATFNVGNPVASLPEPLVEEAPPPLYQFDPAVSLDDAQILVKSNPDFHVGDTVVLHCEGTAPGGTQPPKRFPIQSFWVGRDLPFTLERRFITPNLGQSMRIYYTRERDNTLTRFSLPVNMGVGSRLLLRAPTVVEATVTGTGIATLNPLHVLPPRPEIVTIRVITDTLPPSADIKVYIIGKPGVGSPDIPIKPARPEPGGNYTSFTVPSDFVGAYLGGECTVFYNVIEIGKTSKSDDLTLKIEALAPQELDLVTIPEAVGNQVETGKSYTVLVQGWPFMRQGQAVWIDLFSSSNLDLRIAVPVSNEEFTDKRIRAPIPASYLRSLHEGDTLRAQVLVSLDGTGYKSSAMPLTLSPAYRVKKASGVVEGAIAVGNTPNHLALSSDNSTLYVANFGSKTVSVIDTATRKVTHTISLASAPLGIAIHPNGQTLYVTVQTNSTLVIETDNFQAIKTIGGYTYCSALRLNPTGSRLYVGNDLYPVSQEIETSTNTSVRYLSANYYYANAITTNRSGSRVYITGSYVSEFNQSTGTLLGSYNNGNTESRGIAYSPTEEVLYVTTYGSTPTNGTLNILSATTTPPALIKKIESLQQPWGIAFAPNGDKAYMCLHADNSIKIIDTTTRLITGEINTTTHPLDRPKEIVISSDGGVAYVANSGNNNVIIVSL